MSAHFSQHSSSGMDQTKEEDSAESRKAKNQKKRKQKQKIKDYFNLYDDRVATDLLQELKPAPFVFGLPQDQDNNEDLVDEGAKTEEPLREVSTATNCSLCSVEFANHEEQRVHFKLDWHRYNIKAKLEGQSPITEDDFERLVERYDERDEDNISLSGSESSSTDEDDPLHQNSSLEDIDEGEDEWNSENTMRKRRHPWLFFQNKSGQLMSVQKCVLDLDEKMDDEISDVEKDEHLLSTIGQALEKPWAIFMLGGGHFAGAVFHGKEAIVHKTFHCYTVRAKQGGSQSSADNKSASSHPKSAGASLRRYNEAALVQHVQDIVKLWAPHIEQCTRIFYRTSNHNRRVLFGGKEPPLDKRDRRLKSIPFATRRATFNEVKRVYDSLTLVRLHESDLNYGQTENQDIEKAGYPDNRRRRQNRISPKKKKNINIRRSKSREEKERPLPVLVQQLAEAGEADRGSDSSDRGSDSIGMEIVERSFDHLSEFGNTPVPRSRKSKKTKGKVDKVLPENVGEIELLSKFITACRVGDMKELEKSMKELIEISSENFTEKDVVNKQFSNTLLTPLHVATSAGQRNVVRFLLDRGADPTIKDKAKKVPYNLCPDKETRNIFRSFQGEHPDAFDYKLSQIPPPLTEEELERQKEKKKALREAQRKRLKAKKDEEKARELEEQEKQRYLSLSDREKRALAAEKRLLAQKVQSGESKPVLLRCFQCGTDITGKVPFEYDVYKFCSPKCVREHRQKNKSSNS